MSTNYTREQLLDAWEQQFPASAMYAEEQAEGGDGEREADAYIEQAALRIGHPTSPHTIGLTRGGAAEERIVQLRRELHDAQVNGGDTGSLMRELNDATDQLTELHGTGQADQVIELGRGAAREVRGPRVTSPWRPVA